MQRSRFAAHTAIGSVLLLGCNGAALTCGPGTHAEGTQCLPDVGLDAGTAASDVGTTTDAGPEPADSSQPLDSTPDAPRPHTGAPCAGLHDACDGTHVFNCVLLPGDPRYGTLVDGLVDCALLDGSCMVNAAGSALCTGGDYTACPAGGRRCYDAHVLELCNTVWTGNDCTTTAGDVCRDIPDPDHPGQTTAACAPGP